MKESKTVHVCLIGDGMVGKTKMAMKFSKLDAMPETQADGITNTFTGELTLGEDPVVLTLHDSAGQHEYHRLRASIYKECDVVLLCFSLADRYSFENIKEFWEAELKETLHSRLPVVLVGTTYDANGNVPDDLILPDECHSLKKDIGAASFIRCPVLDEVKVERVMTEAAIAGLGRRKRRNSVLHRILHKI